MIDSKAYEETPNMVQWELLIRDTVFRCHFRNPGLWWARLFYGFEFKESAGPRNFDGRQD